MPNIGDQAPGFTALDIMNGVTFKLSDHKGKIITLSFNQPAVVGGAHVMCLKNIIPIQYLFGFTEIKVVLVIESYGETDAWVMQWVQSQGITHCTVINDANLQIAQSIYGLTGMPRTLIIGTDMKIKNIFPGAVFCDDLVEAVRKERKWKYIIDYKGTYHFTFGTVHVASLATHDQTKLSFDENDFGIGGPFDKAITKYLEAYIKEGMMPPADIAPAILNLADYLISCGQMCLRTGDYIAIKNHIRNNQKGKTKYVQSET